VKISSSLILAGLVLATACTPSNPAPKAEVVPAAPGTVDTYRTWVEGQADGLLTQTEAFVAAVVAGDREKAKGLYAPARMFYERIEPIAEALGDFDPRLDARDGDVPATDWKGFHKLEKALWSNDDLKASIPVAQTLAEDVRLLRAKIETAEITEASMLTGAVELLNEISTSKVTGEEERYSHTDLWDFEANLEGAEMVWTVLSPAKRAQNVELAKTIDARFSSLHGLLEIHRKGDGFRTYTELFPKEIKALSAAVDALAEPLSQVK